MTLLQSYKKKGLVKLIGVNSFDSNVLEYLLKRPEFDCVMLDYSILKQDKESLSQQFHEKGFGVIGGGALANHMYVHPIKKIRGLRDLWYFARAMKNHRKSIEQAENFRFINDVEGLTANQVALAFALAQPNIDCCAFGTTRMNHLKENLSAVDVNLSQDLIERIKSLA
jgi:aryl-alcohol dehydrogenase-like predicted oxidoreductase